MTTITPTAISAELREARHRAGQHAIARRLAGVDRDGQDVHQAQQPADPGRGTQEVQPVRGDAQVGAGQQRGAVAVEAAGEQRQPDRPPSPPGRASAVRRATCTRPNASRTSASRHPPQRGEATARQAGRSAAGQRRPTAARRRRRRPGRARRRACRRAGARHWPPAQPSRARPPQAAAPPGCCDRTADGTRRSSSAACRTARWRPAKTTSGRRPFRRANVACEDAGRRAAAPSAGIGPTIERIRAIDRVPVDGRQRPPGHGVHAVGQLIGSDTTIDAGRWAARGCRHGPPPSPCAFSS